MPSNRSERYVPDVQEVEPVVEYAGTLNPHEPRRFIPFEKIDEWLNEHHQGELDL